jgi:hypothetical protein
VSVLNDRCPVDPIVTGWPSAKYADKAAAATRLGVAAGRSRRGRTRVGGQGREVAGVRGDN